MTTDDLTFSLIINTTDRAGPLKTLLRSLEHQSYPHFEVVVVVGPTRDSTLAMLSEYEGRVRVLRCPEANLCQSRNIGILAARGDIVAFIDDDAVPSQRWLEQLARLFDDSELDATGGVVYLAHPNRPRIQHRIGLTSSLAEQVDVLSSALESIAPPGRGRQWVSRMMGTNMAFRRQALLDVQGFDEFFEWVFDEADVAMRLVNAGKIVHPVKEAAVYHIPASSRNRVAFSYTGRWWIQTKAATYFSIKSGRTGGDPPGAIAMRCLHLLHGHWLTYGRLWKERKITFAQAWSGRLREIGAAFRGVFSALCRPRKLIPLSLVEENRETQESILRFPNDKQSKYPSVDPVSGRQPSSLHPDSAMRICLLSSTYPPKPVGGVGRLTHLMAQGLFECGHTVHVITRGDREQTSFFDGAYVHQIAFRPERYAAYRKFPKAYDALNYSHAVEEKVRSLKLNDGIQIVDSAIWQIEGLVTAVSGVLPVVVRLVTALQQIAEIHKDQSDDARLIGEMERLLIEQASHLLPNTRATLDSVQKAYDVGLTGDQYTIVPYGIVPAPDEEARPFDLNRREETLSVLYVGRLEKRKGIQDLFQAIPLVLKAVPDVEFMITGKDNSDNDGFRRRMGMDYPTYFISRYPEWTHRVRFTGMVSDETLQRLYQSCDLFVAPSLYESFGLIYLEAMNYAKPVIGCEAGGVPEVIEEGVTGLLADPGAPKELAQKITVMLKSPVMLHEMGVAGRERLLEQFTYLEMARRFAEVYRMVIHDFQKTDMSGQEQS